MLNFYRRHVHDLAAVARPLTTLTCKDMATGGNVPFNRSSYCKEAFTELKQRSIAAPVLQPPDLTRPIFVKTDVTIVRFGDVLEQLLIRAEPVKPYWICKSADKSCREKVCPNRIGGMCLNTCSGILWSVPTWELIDHLYLSSSSGQCIIIHYTFEEPDWGLLAR